MAGCGTGACPPPWNPTGKNKAHKCLIFPLTEQSSYLILQPGAPRGLIPAGQLPGQGIAHANGVRTRVGHGLRATTHQHQNERQRMIRAVLQLGTDETREFELLLHVLYFVIHVARAIEHGDDHVFAHVDTATQNRALFIR